MYLYMSYWRRCSQGWILFFTYYKDLFLLFTKSSKIGGSGFDIKNIYSFTYKKIIRIICHQNKVKNKMKSIYHKKVCNIINFISCDSYKYFELIYLINPLWKFFQRNFIFFSVFNWNISHAVLQRHVFSHI